MKILKRLLIFIAYFLIAIVLTGQFGSDKFVAGGDLQFHVASILAAKQALTLHQFPLRISFNMHGGMGYPHFQFYGPFPFTVAGLLNFLISNPFVIYKLIIWLALAVGGSYVYRLIEWLIKSEAIAFLAGAAYITSPYLIVNLLVRQDFTEVIAQGLLPIAIYYSARLYQEYSLKRFLLTSVTWSVLAMTHIITFTYAFGFFSLLIIAIFVVELLSAPTQQRFDIFLKALRLFFAMGLGVLLAAWYLVPAVLYHANLKISSDFGNPYAYHYITTLSSLLAFRPTNVMPYPGTAIGLFFTFGVAICIYAYFFDKDFIKQNKLVGVLLVFFLIIFFVVWSPINFWAYLPNVFRSLQFSYRLITELMLIGVILLSYGLLWLFKGEFRARFVVIFLALILASNSWWLHAAPGTETGAIKSLPKVTLSSKVDDYLWAQPPLNSKALVSKTPLASCHNQGKYRICNVAVTGEEKIIVLPIFYYPHMLTIKANNMEIPYFAVSTLDKVLPGYDKKAIVAGVKLMPGQYQIREEFTGLRWANSLSLILWIFTAIAFLIIPALKKKGR